MVSENSTPAKMSFNLPADFSKATLDGYARLNRESRVGRVAETYGNLTRGAGFIASGRPLAQVPDIDQDRLAAYVAESQRRGIDFVYTLNATHYGNREFSAEGVAAFKRQLHELHEIGVRRLVVTLPQLFEIIRSTGLDFDLTASVLCQVTTANRAAFYQAAGAHRIVLDESLNRNFAELRRIRRAFTGDLEVIVNPYCHADCCYRLFHYNQVAFTNQGEDSATSYFANRCTAWVNDDPANILKRAWIRPEDVHFYREIGIHHFKLQGRHQISLSLRGEEWKGDPVRAAAAYLEEHHEGDLNELIYLFNPIFSNLVPRLDNRLLDGFLEPFVKGTHSCSSDCAACGYCRKFAAGKLDLAVGEYHRLRTQKAMMACDEFAQLLWEAAADRPPHFPL